MSTKIIAELGINHNGSLETLKELADMAMECGADYVKLQLRTPDVCVPKSEWGKPRKWFDETTITYKEYRDRMEFSRKQLCDFNKYMQDKHGQQKWFASIWDIPSLKRLMEFDVPYIKIPSALLTNREVLNECIATGKPIIVSLGMSTKEEIFTILGLIPVDCHLTIMHCNSAYPTKDEEVNLATIGFLQRRYPSNIYTNWKFGFSSHSVSPYPSIYSVLCGAEAVEVHITLDRALMGSDHAASLEKKGFRKLVREIRRIPILMGDGNPQLYESEKPARKKLRGK